jgi:hypothetical protein
MMRRVGRNLDHAKRKEALEEQKIKKHDFTGFTGAPVYHFMPYPQRGLE